MYKRQILHDVGQGAYYHIFERLFDTDHEEITRQIITSPETEINRVLTQVSPDFPEKVASVINHTYPNKQVVQLISSQIDVDRMDYLLRDSFYTCLLYTSRCVYETEIDHWGFQVWQGKQMLFSSCVAQKSINFILTLVHPLNDWIVRIGDQL